MIKVLNDRDNNTNFYHIIASMRGRRNWISRPKVGRKIIKDQNSLKTTIIKHFKAIYKQHNVPKIRLPKGAVKCLDLVTLVSLETLPSEENIKYALWFYDGSRELVYDGFNLTIVKKI